MRIGAWGQLAQPTENGNEVALGVDDPAAVTQGDWTDRDSTFGMGVGAAKGGGRCDSRFRMGARIEHHLACPGAQLVGCVVA